MKKSLPFNKYKSLQSCLATINSLRLLITKPVTQNYSGWHLILTTPINSEYPICYLTKSTNKKSQSTASLALKLLE